MPEIVLAAEPAGRLDGPAHGGVEGLGPVGVDEGHRPLHQAVGLDEGVVLVGEDVDEGVADPHDVERRRLAGRCRSRGPRLQGRDATAGSPGGGRPLEEGDRRSRGVGSDPVRSRQAITARSRADRSGWSPPRPASPVQGPPGRRDGRVRGPTSVRPQPRRGRPRPPATAAGAAGSGSSLGPGVARRRRPRRGPASGGCGQAGGADAGGRGEAHGSDPRSQEDEATTDDVVDAHWVAPVQLGAHRGGPLLERVGRATGSPCGLGARLSPCPGTLARVGGVHTDQHLPCRPDDPADRW